MKSYDELKAEMETHTHSNKLAALRKKVVVSAKDLCPPLFWRLLRKIIGKPPIYPISYQDVYTPYEMTRIHYGEFSEIHKKWALLDTHISRDTNITRLRNYTVFSFAQLALRNTSTGDFLTAGVSFGTAPLVVSETLQNEIQPRKFYLIDPLDGSKTSSEMGLTSYNTDFDLVKSRWTPNVEAVWVREFLSENALSEIPELALIHLNTGDFDSEFSCLSILFEKLVAGGFIVLDLYGWQNSQRKSLIDQKLASINATSFELPTRQLVIAKPTQPLL